MIDLQPYLGVWLREAIVFKRLWLSTTFAAIIEPIVYLLAFGFGLGALISSINGYSYIEFVGTGSVATAVLFSSVFSGMFTTYVRRVYQRTYDGILSTPVDVGELIRAEAMWIALKAGVYGCAPLVVAMFFGLPPSWGMLTVPFIGFVTGFGFASMGQWFSGIVPSIDSFNYVTSALITPLFLVAGTFFPIDGLPTWVQVIAQVNPLYHCVQLVRDACFGWQGWIDLWHLAYLIAFGALMSLLAVRQLRKRLID